MDFFVVTCFAIPVVAVGKSMYEDRDTLFCVFKKSPEARRAQQIEKIAKTMAKEKKAVWRMRDGKLISTASMTDAHLANSIRMIARAWLGKGHGIAKVQGNSNYIELNAEAKKRGFHILLKTQPYVLNGKSEWAEVIIPNPHSRISTNFFPSELEGRQE
jgi:hypothetical protein